MASHDAGLRHRKSSNLDPLLDDEEEEKTAWTDESGPEEDPSLPFQGKVYLARRKKPDTPLTKFLEVCAVIGVVAFIYYSYNYMDDLHFRVTHFYAFLGQPHAMHMVGQRYLFGKGVDRNTDIAMQWFGYASNKGHAHASHNLAVGHLHGYKTTVRDKEHARELLRYAADQGVAEAHDALSKMCARGDC
ncbi:ERAD-associated E3 ubiquitin-protein ligase component HRD3A [Holothuria leucospilota]|uniref:ERAD-associated E3 ubiquitin-protein ligase component HRD3A n=1 Tax=Holothuria leucospilota TaxID=206669 RepID=A0A9Q1HEQ0_HOLLE|nr:ERAD-associated E3 ubiquitin-protein ligase component HRD3A [Holothuria leucospilota]